MLPPFNFNNTNNNTTNNNTNNNIHHNYGRTGLAKYIYLQSSTSPGETKERFLKQKVKFTEIRPDNPATFEGQSEILNFEPTLNASSHRCFKLLMSCYNRMETLTTEETYLSNIFLRLLHFTEVFYAFKKHKKS